MDQPTPSDPARAFADLRAEVSLLRRAIEGLTAERQNAPDYQPTLAHMAERLKAIAGSPAMQLTPEAMEREIADAAKRSRAEDRKIINEAATNLRSSIDAIDGIVAHARTAEQQHRRSLRIGLAAFIAGIMLWAIVPGMIARALPTRWHVPEKIAVRTLRLDHCAAGEHLIATASKPPKESH